MYHVHPPHPLQALDIYADAGSSVAIGPSTHSLDFCGHWTICVVTGSSGATGQSRQLLDHYAAIESCTQPR